MLRQDVVEFDRADFLSSFINEFFYPARDEDISLRILFALISCSEISGGSEGFGVGFFVVEVAFCDVGTFDADFCFVSSRDFIPLLVENGDPDSLADSYGAGFSGEGWGGVGGHLVGGFGHGVGF